MKTDRTLKQIILFALALATFFINGCDEIKDIIDPETEPDVNVGDTLWIYELQDLHFSTNPLAVGTDGTIYTSAGGHGWAGTDWRPEKVLAINKSDGTLKWQSGELEWSQVNSNIVVGDDGTVYVNSGHSLYAINPSNGSFNWVWEVPQTLPGEDGNDVYSYGALGSIALADDGDIITVTAESGVYARAIYKIGAGGVMKWYRFTSSYTVGNTITVGKDGTIFKFDMLDQKYVIVALDPGNGSLKWSVSAYSSSAANNIAIADNGDLIAYVQTDTLARINYSTGQFVWKKNISSWNPSKFIDNNNRILTYNQWNGSALYSVSDGNLVGGPLTLPSNLCIDEKNQLYGAMTSNYNLHVVDENGNDKWESDMAIFDKTIAVSNDKIVYVMSDNKIFALQGDGALAHSGWPRFTHDNRNTFNASKY